MKTDFVIEAEKFATKVYHSINPLTKWSIIVAGNESIIPNDYRNTKLITYKYDGVLDYLKSVGGIKCFLPNHVFKEVDLVQCDGEYMNLAMGSVLLHEDPIYKELSLLHPHIKHITTYKEMVDYQFIFLPIYETKIFSKWENTVNESGSTLDFNVPFTDVSSVLIVHTELEKYINSINEDGMPKILNNSLVFLNQTIPLKGKQLTMLRILVKKINSSVSHKVLYEACYPSESYDKSIFGNRVSKLHDLNKSTLQQLKSKISLNKILSDRIYFKESNGIGLYIKIQK